MEKINLFEMYKEWREESEENKDAGMFPGKTSSGEASVREDFSEYAGLSEEISFEDMFELEKEYYEKYE